MTQDTNRFKFDGKAHVYTLDDKPLSGVTSVLKIIAKPMLVGWASRMAIEYVESVGELKDDVMTVNEWSEERELAINAHTRHKNKAGAQGTDTHAEIERFVKDCIVNTAGVPAQFEKASPALQSFIDWSIEKNIKFIESEKQMYSERLWLAGTCDLVFEQDGKRYVGDVKTQKKMWDRVPFLQTAAYMSMLKETDKEHYDGSCIINIPKETNKVETFYSYDWESDLKAFEACLTLYRALQNEV